jgi:hypothetical protein
VGFGWSSLRRYPLRFFLSSTALIGVGVALLDQTTSTEPRWAGAIMAVGGFALLVVLTIRGIVNLSQYLPRMPRGVPLASPDLMPQTQPVDAPQSEADPPQQLPQPGQSQENPPPGERPVKILMVGHSGSGKTLLLASLYHHFSLGGKAGIRFVANEESNRKLVGLADAISDPSRDLPPSTRVTERWKFTVQVASSDQKADAFTLEYLDYAGGSIDRMLDSPDSPHAAEFDQELKGELKSTDVLMGVLDGDQIAKLMAGNREARIVRGIHHLLNILIQTEHRNIHLVITKWDSIQGPGGAHYTISDVRQRLDQELNAFQHFRENPWLETSMRIIPVSALGVNGFAYRSPDGSMARRQGTPWMPWNVAVPFFSAIPDILTSDIPNLAKRRAGALSKIGIAVFSIAKLIEVGVPLGVIDLRVPATDVIHQVMDFVHKGNSGSVPAPLTAESALSYVLSKSYTALNIFEREWPDSRAQPGTHE